MTSSVERLAGLPREVLVRRGLRLNTATIGYNALEGVLSVALGLVAGSVALIGFGVDSVIEVGASLAAMWRLRVDIDAVARRRAERRALRIVGGSFLLLAAYVTVDAVETLLAREVPAHSIAGIVITTASLVVMPWLARAKRRVAYALQSGALVAEARQTAICAYLSAIVLVGLALNAALGWWWADPLAALALVPFIAWEGVNGVRGRSACADGCHTPRFTA